MAVRETDLTRREYLAVLRQDFCAFIERSFYQINPQTRFLWNWHIEAMAAKLEACRRGEISRLIIKRPAARPQISLRVDRTASLDSGS
jgi:hypothetical protein